MRNLQKNLKTYRELHDSMDMTPSVPGGVFQGGPGIQVTETLYTSLATDKVVRPRSPVPAAARAIAMAMERPDHTIAGMSALAVFGLPYFADHCHTTLFGLVKRNKPPTQFSPLIQRPTTLEHWHVYFEGVPLKISPPAIAVISALNMIRSGIHRWAAPRIDGFTYQEMQSIQLIDASRRFLDVNPEDIFAAGKGRVNKRWLQRIVDRTTSQADSPKETEMRLLAQALCKDLGLIVHEQYPLWAGRSLVTVFDLAVPELKIAIMYDGEHHLKREQRDWDSQVNVEAALQGWTVIRVTAGTLPRLPEFLMRAARTAC